MEDFEPSFFVYGLFQKSGPDAGTPRYIGKGHHHERANSHARAAAKGGHSNPHLTNIILKHGVIEDFLIAGLTETEAFAEERRLIKKIGRMDLGTGPLANMTDGGDGATGAVRPPEWRAARSATMTARNADLQWRAENTAKIIATFSTPEWKAAQSALLSSQRSTPEWREASRARANEQHGKRPEIYYPATAVNPRKPGTHGHRSMGIIIANPGLSYRQFIAFGGRSKDLRHDNAHGNVLAVSTAAQLAEAAD